MICKSLIINDVYHLCLAIHMSSFEKSLFRSSPMFFLIGLFVFLMLSCRKFVYFGDQSLVSCFFANIFSHSVGCLFVLFMVTFAVQKLLSSIISYLFIFVFIVITLEGSEKILLQFMSGSVQPMFSFKTLILSDDMILYLVIYFLKKMTQ